MSPADFDATALAFAAPATGNLPTETVGPSLLPGQHTGWMGRPGVSGSRAGKGWSPRWRVRQIRLDGQEIQPGGFVSAGASIVQVEAGDQDLNVGLTLTVELTVGGLLRAQAAITNQAADPYTLDDLVISFPVPAVAREILDFAGRWGKERTPQRTELVVGTHLREGRHGRTGADAATVLHVGTPGFSFAEGEVWSVHTGWSGNHTHYAERLSTGEQVLGGGELLLPGEVRLAEDESYQSPWIYGSYGVGLDQVARRFHTYLRSRPQHPCPQRPVTLNVWEAVYFDHDLHRLVDLAERAADFGVERYVLDDGWFSSRRDDTSGLGDWTVSAEVWPDGLHPLVNTVRSLGMEFGLWFEPEMVNPDSEVARAHPEWIMAPGHGRLPIESRHQQVINLGIEECYAYVRDAMVAILDEYDIDCLKWDHNRDLIEAGTAPYGEPGVHAQTVAVYRLLDELKATHPELEIESCSSGGGRVDLGILERCDRVWVSDCIDPLDRQCMNRWTTQLIPPEMMGSHIASGRSHTTGRVHDLSFRAASAVFGHLGIEWDLAEASEAELADLRQWIGWYQANRSLLLNGSLVRGDHPDQTAWLHGVVAHDQSRAIYSLAVLGRSEVSPRGRIRLPGLDHQRRYLLTPVIIGTPPVGLTPARWWQDADELVFPGAVLAQAGVQAPLLFPDQAVLFEARAVGD